MKKSVRFLVLHIMLLVYSLGGIFSKSAAGQDFMSPAFILYYAGFILILGIYAIGWQQVIKFTDLSVAYANRAVVIVWGIVWGAVIFGEEISAKKLIGAAVIVAGVILFAFADNDKNKIPPEINKPAEGGHSSGI